MSETNLKWWSIGLLGRLKEEVLVGPGDSREEGKEAAGERRGGASMALPGARIISYVHEDSVRQTTYPSWVKQMPQETDIHSTHW